jgi:hypothetical protein
VVGIPFVALDGFPTVFARVSNLADWIEEQITNDLHFAQAGTGGNSVASDFVIQNLSKTQNASVSLRFFDPDGTELPMTFIGGEVTSQLDFELLPLQTKTFSTDPTGDLVLGPAVASSIGEIAGVIRFTLAGIGIAGVSSGQPVSGALVPARRQGDLNTAIAIRNTGNESVSVNAVLLKDGKPVNNGTGTIVLPPLGREALFISEIFKNADTIDFTGEVMLEAEDGKFAALALELGTNAGEFTILPVNPLEE